MSAWSVLTVSVLVVAGVVAGIIGTAGGITSLVAYPALLAVGLPPFAANVTNSVALLGSGASSAFRAREQLRDHPTTIRRWLPLTVGASTAGAVLLVVTPAHLFDRIVPFLVLAGGALLLLQPVLDRRRRRTPTGAAAPTGTGAAVPSIAGVGLYNGYFGAGAGVLMIAVLLLTGEPSLPRANAAKNVLLVAADLVPAVVFAVSGHVVWSAALALGAGAVVGGLIGPTVAGRVPHGVLRIAIAGCSVALAVYLFVTVG
ncbi:sulfite exporter TauE/SafE family protein [Curtobacterium sp. 458]|uniref:sulfite exporter TauE/SafE family protein n=1 Tax=Curtobacterium sp. 458 TaxID=3050069 RepID=UPI0025B4C34C|nr:sulfite exporter TauE/SafE family protein [Curtobacterium sp. 458]WJY00313.1 sulfite exporter TauE/SafE family protein [Curtobacterium sp. 458]